MKYITSFHVKFYNKEKRFLDQANFTADECYASEADCLEEAKQFVISQLGTKEWVIGADKHSSELVTRYYATIDKVKTKQIEEFSSDPNSVKFIKGR